MKYKNTLFVAFGLFAFSTLIVFGYVKGHSENNIEVIINSPKEIYSLGELIPVTVEINNLVGNEVTLINTIDPIYGSLKLYISNQDKSISYQYMNPKFGILEPNGFVKIKANEKYSNSIRVLARLKSYNHAEYLFNESGVYYLQVSYQIQMVGQTNPVEIKSAPIKITITEPQGEDLEVWNKIKDNGEFADFIQEGEITRGYHKPEEQAKFQQEVDDIVNHYPNSFLSGQIKQSLVKFQAQEAKKKAYLEKMNKPE